MQISDMSQVTKIHLFLSLYIYTSYGFCFSGEPWLIPTPTPEALRPVTPITSWTLRILFLMGKILLTQVQVRCHLILKLLDSAIGTACFLAPSSFVSLPPFLEIYLSLCFFVCLFFGCAMRYAGSQFPVQGSNPRPLQWKHRVLTTGPPGKSLFF